MKLGICFSILLALLACGDGGAENNRANDEGTRDSVNSTPSAIDTTQHPNGITSGSVISTDTAAMRADTNARP